MFHIRVLITSPSSPQNKTASSQVFSNKTVWEHYWHRVAAVQKCDKNNWRYLVFTTMYHFTPSKKSLCNGACDFFDEPLWASCSDVGGSSLLVTAAIIAHAIQSIVCGNRIVHTTRIQANLAEIIICHLFSSFFRMKRSSDGLNAASWLSGHMCFSIKSSNYCWFLCWIHKSPSSMYSPSPNNTRSHASKGISLPFNRSNSGISPSENS